MNDKAYATVDRIGTLTGGVAASAYGTAVNYTLPTWVKAVLALYVIGVHLTTVTAAEGQSGILRLNSKSLGFINSEFSTCPIMTSAPATNESGYSCISDVIPLDVKTNGGETISFDAAPAGASTEGVVYDVGILMSNKPEGLPPEWKLKFPSCVGFRDGKVENAQQLTVAEAAVGNPIKVPNWAEAIVGYKTIFTKTGAITAAQAGLGYFNVYNSIGITPFTLPATFATSATLGTPVGTSSYSPTVPYIPIYIPVGGKEESFTPKVVLDKAVTTDNRVAIALAWR